MTTEKLNWLQEEMSQLLTRNIPSDGELCSFTVNTDCLKEQLAEMYPGFEVEINPLEGYEFEVVFKKMVNIIEIEIDTDKITEEIRDGR